MIGAGFWLAAKPLGEALAIYFLRGGWLLSLVPGFGFGYSIAFLWVPRAEFEKPGGRDWLAKKIGTRRIGLARAVAWVGVVVFGLAFAVEGVVVWWAWGVK